MASYLLFSRFRGSRVNFFRLWSSTFDFPAVQSTRRIGVIQTGLSELRDTFIAGGYSFWGLWINEIREDGRTRSRSDMFLGRRSKLLVV